MEGFIGSSVCRGVRSCWAHRRRSCGGYQRLRAPTTTASGRGTIRLGRRTVLGAAAWRWRLGGRLRRRASAPRWSSPLQLLNRILDTYIASMLSQPLNILKAAGATAAAPAAAGRSASSPPKLRRDASPPGSSSRRRDANGGRGVMLNICVAEVLLLRRTTSEIRRSPLQAPQQEQPRKDDARRSSVHRA